MTVILSNTENMTDEDVEGAAQFVQGLLDLAAWLSSHPQWASGIQPYSGSRYVYGGYMAEAREGVSEIAVQELATLARELAPCEKQMTDSYYTVMRHFGPHEIDAYAMRENVCVKHVVGTKTVERYTLSEADEQAYNAMQREYRAVKEDVVEWECAPLLKP